MSPGPDDFEPEEREAPDRRSLTAQRPGKDVHTDPAQRLQPDAIERAAERAGRDVELPVRALDEAQRDEALAPVPVEEDEAQRGEPSPPPPIEEEAETAERAETSRDGADPFERREGALPPTDMRHAERSEPAIRPMPSEGESTLAADRSRRISAEPHAEEAEAAAELPVEDDRTDPAEKADRQTGAEAVLPLMEPLDLEERVDVSASLDAEEARSEQTQELGELPAQEEEAQHAYRPDELSLTEQVDELWTAERLGELRRTAEEASALSDRDRNLAENFAESIRLQDRTSPSDLEGHSGAENRIHLEDAQTYEMKPTEHHSGQISAMRAIHHAGEGLQGSNDTFREIVDQLFEQERVGLDQDVHKLLHEQIRVELVLQRAGDDERLREALWIAAEKPGDSDASPQAQALRSAFDEALETKLRGDDALRAAFERVNVSPRIADTTREFMKRFDAESEALLRQQKLEFLDDYEAAYRSVFDKNPGLVSEDQQAQIRGAIEAIRAQVMFEDRRRRR